MGGHGHDEPYYLHAKHMYNLHRMKHQGLKVTLSVLGAVSIALEFLYTPSFSSRRRPPQDELSCSQGTIEDLI
ncbi:hypothetical protein PR202_ga20302 [Eleusine coracana subsp. coracana]|uniref:Uncharacterized protein n=1 Tax=Eleusine coracana subsp. coracana TaxID=191504 RepID=A0AAV5CY38_ELECO|nr:hypothetical protein PR202_ga20302 [Eleusine coracana subsp. coracana]